PPRPIHANRVSTTSRPEHWSRASQANPSSSTQGRGAGIEPAPLLLRAPLVAVQRGDEIGNEMRGVGCTQAGDRVPTLGRGIARNARVTLIGVISGDVEEVGGVASRARSDRGAPRGERVLPALLSEHVTESTA